MRKKWAVKKLGIILSNISQGIESMNFNIEQKIQYETVVIFHRDLLWKMCVLLVNWPHLYMTFVLSIFICFCWFLSPYIFSRLCNMLGKHFVVADKSDIFDRKYHHIWQRNNHLCCASNTAGSIESNHRVSKKVDPVLLAFSKLHLFCLSFAFVFYTLK